MMRSGLIAALLLVVSVSAFAQTVTVVPLRLTPAQYLDELDKWQHYIEGLNDETADEEAPEIPPEWVVQSPSGDHHVSTDFLRALGVPSERKRALDHLHDLREAASTAFEPMSRKPARQTADSILRRREYRGVHVPGKKESWIDRATAWLMHFIAKLFGKAYENSAAIRTFVSVLSWALLLGAASLLFLWLFRTLKALSTPELALEGGPAEFVSSKPAETWLAEAKQAAADGQYRLAICLAYWAGIAGLERAGAWRPDRARTPREYLRHASNAPFLPTLRGLTRDFERTWYAKQPASAADFSAALQRVKELGWQ
jgi:hypothetical protein